VKACVLDADVVIAALDRADAHHRAAARTLKRLVGERTRLLLSLVNYAEALVRPGEDDITFRAALDALDAMGIELVPPTAAIARDAARLRSSGISLPDGFALATAMAHDTKLAAFDSRVRRVARSAGVALETST
jgi:predicted nucleic acid-binding protein